MKNSEIDIKAAQKQALKDQIRASMVVIFDLSPNEMDKKQSVVATPNEIIDWVFQCIALPIIETKKVGEL